jgi:hypothetical protein
MIDRAARNQIAGAIRLYLDDKITAFQFDDVIQEASCKTKDKTAQEMVQALWYYYDDVTDHKIHATKEVWDYFHRILLLLESDGELEITKIRRWSFRQFAASCTLAVFLLVAFRLGWGEHLYFVSIPFGLISILLSFWHSKTTCKPDRMEIALTPFPSITDMFKARRQAAVFKKKPYPVKLKYRALKDSFIDTKIMWPLKWLAMIIGSFIFAPLSLLFQTMPETVTKMKVKML